MPPQRAFGSVGEVLRKYEDRESRVAPKDCVDGDGSRLPCQGKLGVVAVGRVDARSLRWVGGAKRQAVWRAGRDGGVRCSVYGKRKRARL